MARPEVVGMKVRKKKAADLVGAWAEGVLRIHEEPVRAGKKRGELIGFGRTKRMAALLQVLHPAFTTDEIAKLAKTSGGLLRKWRTEPEFKKVSRKDCESLGKTICNSWVAEQEEKEPQAGEARLEIKVDGLSHSAAEWIYALPFLNARVRKIACDFLKKKVDSGKTVYAGFLAELELDRTGDKEAYRRLRSQWMRTPEWLSEYRGMIEDYIDLLASPEAHARYGKEEIQGFAGTVKKMISALINELAE